VADGETPGTAGFADGHAVHILSESIVDQLNERIAAGGVQPVPMERFRPNIVVSGWGEPHIEDHARTMTIDGYAKLCVRCSVPMVDQKTGPEPIRTLAGYRRGPGGGVIFGSKAAVTTPGQLAVGAEVIVHSWAGSTRSSSAAEPPFTATESRPAESA
jgi:uncharacterized protein YcbX